MSTVRRLLDPNLRDYVLTLGGYEEDVGVTTKVYARVATRKGSIVPLPSFGSLLHTIAGPFVGFETLAKRYVGDAIAGMVRSREIRQLVVEVSTERTAGGIWLTTDINYRDRRGRPQRVKYTYRLTGA